MIRKAEWIVGMLAVALFAGPAAMADSTTSSTGTLSSSITTYSQLVTVGGTSNESVTFQTWGFGGGVNGAGTTIEAGGFDSFVGVFSGTGTDASILTDAMGNAYGVSDLLSNFASFQGCPPAGTVNIGGSVCGDIKMTLSLVPGTYTVLLSDAGYIPNAVFDNGTLGEGFTDFTGGGFQTCNTTDSGTTCANDTGNWALDVSTTGGSTVPTPEPTSLLLLASGLFSFGVVAKGFTTAARKKHRSPQLSLGCK